MTRKRTGPKPAAVVDLGGVVRIKKARGGGWQVGEIYRRDRNGDEGVEMVRSAYFGETTAAVQDAVSRASLLCGASGVGKHAQELLGAFAELGAWDGASYLAHLGDTIRERFERSALTRTQLVRESGVSRATLYRVLNQGRTPNHCNAQLLIVALRLSEDAGSR